MLLRYDVGVALSALFEMACRALIAPGCRFFCEAGRPEQLVAPALGTAHHDDQVARLAAFAILARWIRDAYAAWTTTGVASMAPSLTVSTSFTACVRSDSVLIGSKSASDMPSSSSSSTTSEAISTSAPSSATVSFLGIKVVSGGVPPLSAPAASKADEVAHRSRASCMARAQSSRSADDSAFSSKRRCDLRRRSNRRESRWWARTPIKSLSGT
mmetsp:Transcript_35635/g.93531  ORF Transcript_35635/g.93531 Transcript_35635/m.93531 type:complete len:214 (+) Transcript_35635:118-759(+)